VGRLHECERELAAVELLLARGRGAGSRGPGGISGQGKEACAEFFAGWFGAFPDAHVEVHAIHITGDVAVEEGTFTGTHNGVLRSPAGVCYDDYMDPIALARLLGRTGELAAALTGA
jgi:SnoaL-like domain